MSRRRQDIINDFIEHPSKLLMKRPFFRGVPEFTINDPLDGIEAKTFARKRAVLPNMPKIIVSQERFAKELDPSSHKVIFDTNLPSICVKAKGNNYVEIEYKRFGIALQERIRDKSTLSLCGNPRIHVLDGSNPDDTTKNNYATFKWYWKETNQDGIGTKAVATQKSYGDVGLLYYMNEDNKVRTRLFSYADGYQIISHKDDNGEPLIDAVYYCGEDGARCIDAYDNTYHYHFSEQITLDETTSENKIEWGLVYKERHGFTESPLCTKRGDVPWNNAEDLIELFEIIFNIFAVIQKRHGWGILYIKGKILESAKKLAGSIILQDTTMDGKGDVDFKTPPSPQNMIEFMQSILDQIQIACGCTFILPKDVKSSGDISGLAIQMTRSLDIERTASEVIDWQNFVSKQSRLFKEGLAKQLVSSGENPRAITEFENMRISTSFKPWQPFDEYTYNQMLCTLKSAGLISTKTGVEKNTISTPDEEVRLSKEQDITINNVANTITEE